MAVEAQERTQLVNELLERIGETVGKRAQVSTIFGEPVQREGVTVIPVAKTRFGFGGGGGSGLPRRVSGSAEAAAPAPATRARAGVEAVVWPSARSATSRCATVAQSSSGSPHRRICSRSSPPPRSPRSRSNGCSTEATKTAEPPVGLANSAGLVERGGVDEDAERDQEYPRS